VAIRHHEEPRHANSYRIVNPADLGKRSGAASPMQRRVETRGADHDPSEDEQALIEQRRLLKEERDKREAKALLPKPSAADRLVRTHHPEAKDKPKLKKERPQAKASTQSKDHKSRAEKHAAKAAALDAARKSSKKPAK